MKTIVCSLALLGLLFVAGCSADVNASTDANGNSVTAGTQTVSFDVPDMTCAGCCGHVQETLAAMEGVSECTVSLEDKTATCVVDPATFKTDVALAKLADEGYTGTVNN